MGYVPENDRAEELFLSRDREKGRKAKKKGEKHPRKRYDEEDEWGRDWNDYE